MSSVEEQQAQQEQPRTHLEDWEREARGYDLYPKAYTRPVMGLINSLDELMKRVAMNRFRALGVQSGLCVDATPLQRKRFMLWAEERWPEVVKQVPSWPKPSLAAQFQRARREGRYDDALKPEERPVTPTHSSIAPRNVPGPRVALVIVCYCGQRYAFKPSTGEFHCVCGGVIAVTEMLVHMRPPASLEVTFGADPEGEGLKPYEGTSARRLPPPPKRQIIRGAQPVVAKSVEQMGDEPTEYSDEVETGMPHGFTSMFGGQTERSPDGFEKPHWGPPSDDYPSTDIDLDDPPY